MPAIVVASLITAGAAGAGTIYASKKQSSAAKKAQQTSLDTTDKTIAFERERDIEDRRRYDEEIAMLRQKHEAEQAELARMAALDEQRYAEKMRIDAADRAQEQSRYDAKEARLQPFRQAGTVSMQDLAARAAQASATPPPVIPGMSRDPYAVLQAPPPTVSMRQLAQPPPTTMHVADLDPRYRRPA